MTRRSLYAVVAALFACVSCATAATSNATIWGTVYDSAGKPAPNITVVLDNASLGVSRSVTTDSNGSYTIYEVPPADGYRVTAINAGERWDVRLGVTVNVGDERVVIPPLRQAQVAAPPTPKPATRATNDTISSSVSGVIAAEQLRQLPLFNRNFLTLGLLIPGTHEVPAGSPLLGASFSISGTAPGATIFLLDGVENFATSTNQAIPFQVNDSIQEFRVVSANANAEYGRALGGVVNIATRRAGNSAHGSAFGYFSSDVLNASNPLSLYNGTTFDQAAAYAGNPNSFYSGFYPLTYNDYVSSARLSGACTNSIVAPSPGTTSFCQAGGPFGIPYPAIGRNDSFLPQQILSQYDQHKQPFTSEQFGVNEGGALIKDKLFLFGSYEGTRIDNPNAIFERVPSAFDKTYNPLLARGVGQPFKFPANDRNYVLAQQVLSLYPASNVVGVPDALEFYRGEAPNSTHVHNGILRGDMLLSPTSTLTLRYAIQDLSQLHDDSLPAQSKYPGNGAIRDSLNHNFALTFSKFISPSTLSETRVAFNQFGLVESPQDASTNPSSLLGLPFAQVPTFLLNGIDPQYGGTIPLTDGASGGWGEGANTGEGLSFAPTGPTLDYKFPFARIGAPLTAPSSSRDRNWLFQQIFTLTRNKHSLRMGADVRFSRNSYFDGSFSRGLVYSSNIGQFTSNSEGCNQACRFLDEQGQKPFVAFKAPTFDFALRDSTAYTGLFRSYALAGFVQDTWRVNPRLTLNAGLRYDFFSTPNESRDHIWNFEPASNRLVQQGSSKSVDNYGQPCSPGADFKPNPDIPLLSAQPLGGIAFSLTQSSCLPTAHGGISPDSTDLGPRIGFAWDIFGTGHTVVRAGFGYYYQPIQVRSFEQLLYNRPVTQPNAMVGSISSLGNSQSGICNISASLGGCALGNAALYSHPIDQNIPNAQYDAVTQPFSTYAIDTQHANTPMARQINLSIQQQISGDFTVEVAYVGSRGGHLPVVYNSNFNTEFNYSNVFSPKAVSGSFTDNQLFPVFTLTNQARSNYHSLIARAVVKSRRGLFLTGSYTYSKSLDNDASATFPMVPISANNFNLGFSSFAPNGCVYRGGCGTAPIVFPTINYSLPAVTTTGQAAVQVTPYALPQNPFTFLQDDYGASDFDSRHRVVIDLTWRLPVQQRWMKLLFGNTELSAIEIIRSGQPFTIFAGPILNEVTQRAEILGPVAITDNPFGAIATQNVSLAPCERFSTPSTTGPYSLFLMGANQPCVGNSGRNAFTGPAYLNTDAALQRDFHLPGHAERVLSFRAEAFNLMNSANFYNPISTISADGINLNPDFGKIKSAYSPRQLQFAARFSW